MKNQFFVLGHCVSSVWTPELKKRDQYLEDAMEKEEKKKYNMASAGQRVRG